MKIVSILLYPFITAFVLIFFKNAWNVKKYLQTTTKPNQLLVKWWNIYIDLQGSYIGYNSTIPFKPVFPHGIKGIFISGGTKIGKNATIFQNVTIGSNTLGYNNNTDLSKFGSPEIGDNVYIGAGAAIIGNIKIGNNCRIGANTSVYTNMPDNCVAVSAPTRIIQKENLDNRFYQKNKKDQWGYYEDGVFNLVLYSYKK